MPSAPWQCLFVCLTSRIDEARGNTTALVGTPRQVAEALAQGDITRQQFEHLTVAINTGTNIPSVATPNGQAAFLFLLTSSLAPLLRLSYGRMVVMALPYTVTMTGMGLLAVAYWL